MISRVLMVIPINQRRYALQRLLLAPFFGLADDPVGFGVTHARKCRIVALEGLHPRQCAQFFQRAHVILHGQGLAKLRQFLLQHAPERFVGNAVLDIGLGIPQLAPRLDVRLHVGVAGHLVALRGQRDRLVLQFLLGRIYENTYSEAKMERCFLGYRKSFKNHTKLIIG